MYVKCMASWCSSLYSLRSMHVTSSGGNFQSWIITLHTMDAQDRLTFQEFRVDLVSSLMEMGTHSFNL